MAEEGVSFREVAEAIGEALNVPTVSIPEEEADSYFGWLAMFCRHDMPASSALTRKRLGWHPTEVGLIEDLGQGKFV